MRAPTQCHDRQRPGARCVLVILFFLAVLGTEPAAAASQEGRFVDRGEVVLDRQTNLMWEKKDEAGGLHDVNGTYTWCQATGTTQDVSQELICKENTYSWIGEVNAEGLAGFNDWRVPTIDELLTIVDTSAEGCGAGEACIDPIFGPTNAFRYWASDGRRRTSNGSVDFRTGSDQRDFQLNRFHVRAVRNVQ